MRHEFFPMLNRTLKSLLKIPNKHDVWQYVKIMTEYPNHDFIGLDITPDDNLVNAILTELARQYNRWYKGEEE